MADAERVGLGRPAMIAIGFAVVALVTSVVAVVVVARRGGDDTPAVAKGAAVIERAVDASEVTKLKRDVVEKVDGPTFGVSIKDEALRNALGLEAGDVITAIGGRVIKREFDVYDAILGMSMMDASIVYVDIVRAKHPVLVRWKLEGDLRAARRDPSPTPAPRRNIFGAPRPNPFTAPRDPLVGTIERIDALTYEVPRSTIDQMLANPDVYAKTARIVPSMRGGQPDGFRIYAIRPDSIWFAIGLANGDTIRSVNGNELAAPGNDAYDAVKHAKELRLDIVRRGGGEETIVITVK
jgi:type II secretory pathway component PulC